MSMNTRNTRYIPLSTDPESTFEILDILDHDINPPSLMNRLKSLANKKRFRLALLISLLLTLTFVFLIIYTILWGGGDLIFHPSSKPSYLDIPVDRPLVIRLAIIARVDEFERREVIREAVLYGVPVADVKLEYKFFVGRARFGATAMGGMEGERTMWKLEHENRVHGDIVIMQDIEDISERISEKRYNALKWANTVPPDQYDYAMTIDSDTFCRFRTLARRLRYVFPSLRPRDEPILIGRMSQQAVYYENTVPDGDDMNDHQKEEDRWVSGPVYPYPVGIGYMLSSNLTATILSVHPSIPHHIHYPYDDVMIGSWVAGLTNLEDPNAVFETTTNEERPAPYLPNSIHTTVIDDPVAWHDYRHRGGVKVAHAIGWETACVHRMSAREMMEFRMRKEIKMEWDYR